MKVKLVFFIFYLLCLFNSSLVMSAVQLPKNVTTNINMTGKLRSYLEYSPTIFLERSGHDTSHPEYYRSNHWLCYSATDAANGACPVTSSSGGGDTIIKLDFIEEKTKQKVQLQLKARAESYDCAIGFRWSMNSIGYSTCSQGVAYGKRLDVILERSEAQKIPFGGIWKATLKIRQRNYGGPGAEFNAVWASNIKLDMYDTENISIYFPEFHSATPTVDLNLQSHPSTSRPGQIIDGIKTIDMCLYDGRNAASSWYDITVTDEMRIGDRDNNNFSVLKNNNLDKAARNRIDYQVTLKHNGSEIPVNNNKVMRLTNIANAEQRVVTLPNMTQPVICTPTPLTLITQQFNQIDKGAGAYSGKLKVIFTPST